jgi:long-chain acyl-CoA synthetase
MMMVSECIVIQDGAQLIGLVYPDMDEAKAMNFTQEDLENIMAQHCIELNNTLPAFSKLSSIRLMEQEFEKTPKRSIKRHLYQKP